jgi:GT2 family glycosyltransferase
VKRVTAVVLNWNRPDDTIACVRSLQSSGYPDLDLVVVDNASTDDSAVRIQAELGELPLLCRPSNDGYAAGNNAGIKYALAHGADYVLVLNNDVIVTPGFLDPMVAEMDSDPAIGIVTCDARFQSDRSRTYPTGGSISLVRGAGVRLPNSRRSHRSEVGFVSGCILLVRRAVLETVGLFDETFFMYFEDVEYSRRVSSAFRMVYTPDATVYHRSGGGETWGSQSPTYLYYMARNRFFAFRRESALYRIYLVVLGGVSATAKSAAILVAGVRNGRLPVARKQLRALWSGLLAGVTLSPAAP